MNERNAFGDLIVPPERLTRRQRIDTLRKLAGALQADSRHDVQWLGRRLSAWLQDGGELDAMLGVRAERGSHHTPQHRVRREEIDGLLLRLSIECGGDAAALEVLKGNRLCRMDLAPVVQRLLRMRSPISESAFTRARQRLSRHPR